MAASSAPRYAKARLINFFAGNLSRAAGVLFGLITVITVSCSGYDFVLMQQEKAVSAAKETRDQIDADLLVKLVGLQKQIQIDVVQIQQFLSDYSATRGQDGQDDGLDNAAKFAERFPKDVAAAKKAAAAYESPDLVNAFAQIEKSLPEFYSRGVQMAKVYAAQGPTAGNKLMKNFDEISDAMQQGLEETSASLEAGTRRHAATAASKRSQIAELRDRQSMIGMINVGIIAITCGLAFLATRRWVIQPLSWITFTFDQLVQDNTNFEVYEANSRVDEIGILGRTYGAFRKIAKERSESRKTIEAKTAAAEAERRKNDEAREKAAAEQEHVIRLLGSGLAKLASCELTWRMTDEVPQAYRRLQSDFNAAIDQLEAAMAEVKQSAGVIGVSANQIAGAADDLSRRTEQQAATLEETTAALGEITSLVKHGAEGASHASMIVGETKTNAEKNGEVARKAVDAIARIEKSSQGITQIIGVIDEIAFQTNLLALNAGVEAARAGEAGRGFAVVASEVRALAQRSAEAAKEIKMLIATASSEVDQGVELVGQTVKALEAIVVQVGEINRIVADIASGSKAQAAGLAEINVAVGQIDQNTQKNAAMVEETTAATNELRSETVELERAVGSFQITRSLSNSPVNSTSRRAANRGSASALRLVGGQGQGSAGSAARKLSAMREKDSWEEF